MTGKEMFELVKSANPRIRRTRPTAIIYSRENSTVYDCVFCGSQISCARRHRQSTHVNDFRIYHDAGLCQRGREEKRGNV